MSRRADACSYRWLLADQVEAVEPPLRRSRRDAEASGASRDVADCAHARAPRPPASAARPRRRSPRARGRGRRPARRPATGRTSAAPRPTPRCAWQIQWPSSWAIVKRWRRVGVSPLIASDALTTIRRSDGISFPEHSPRSRSSIRRPSRSSAIDSTGTGISSAAEVASTPPGARGRAGRCTWSGLTSRERSSDDQERVHPPSITVRTYRPYGQVRLASLRRTVGGGSDWN